MMPPARRHALGECAALAIPLLAALLELLIREVYHRISAEPTRFVYLALIAIASLGLLGASELACRPGRLQQTLRCANRLLGLLAWVWIVAIRGGTLTGWWHAAPAGLRIAAVTGALALAWLAFGETRWCRVRAALLAGALLFVASQPILGRAMSPALNWPEASPRAGASAQPGDGVVFLLLDELNARESPALARVLREHGMMVAERAIVPVANATAKVIPEIWSGQRFARPKPCSFTAICSEGNALDFARITASRPDIDVVGFYHPYCAMQGLRWCERVELPLPFDEADRWICSIRSRIGWTDSGRCMAQVNEPFLRLRTATLEAFWRAPFWRQGGMLFTHLPLPHPPGARTGGTLEQDYRDNLVLAAEVLGRVVDRARAAGLQRVRVVVFSDHPLRQSLWCGKPAYQARGCRPAPELEDDKVPLIVGTFGAQLPDLQHVESNGQVFGLAAGP